MMAERVCGTSDHSSQLIRNWRRRRGQGTSAGSFGRVVGDRVQADVEIASVTPIVRVQPARNAMPLDNAHALAEMR